METYNALDIAKEFLKVAYEDHNSTMSHMKLQKLVYFAHGWYLGLTNKPLLNETLEAWKYGPVIHSVYEEYKKYGSQLITPDASYANKQVLSKDIKDLIKKIWEVYGRFTASQLSTLTHETGSPWDQTTADYSGDLPPNLKVSNDIIAKYFEKQKSK